MVQSKTAHQKAKITRGRPFTCDHCKESYFEVVAVGRWAALRCLLFGTEQTFDTECAFPVPHLNKFHHVITGELSQTRCIWFKLDVVRSQGGGDYSLVHSFFAIDILFVLWKFIVLWGTPEWMSLRRSRIGGMVVIDESKWLFPSWRCLSVNHP